MTSPSRLQIHLKFLPSLRQCLPCYCLLLLTYLTFAWYGWFSFWGPDDHRRPLSWEISSAYCSHCSVRRSRTILSYQPESSSTYAANLCQNDQNTMKAKEKAKPPVFQWMFGSLRRCGSFHWYFWITKHRKFAKALPTICGNAGSHLCWAEVSPLVPDIPTPSFCKLKNSHFGGVEVMTD